MKKSYVFPPSFRPSVGRSGFFVSPTFARSRTTGSGEGKYVGEYFLRRITIYVFSVLGNSPSLILLYLVVINTMRIMIGYDSMIMIKYYRRIFSSLLDYYF